MKHLQHGYTIVELITVMVVVGILAAIAIPRISNTSEFSANAYRNEIASALRHAQKSAVSHRRVVCADLTADKIKLQIAVAVGSSDCKQDYLLPDGSTSFESREKILASGALVGNVLLFMPSGEIHLNTAGRPFATGTIGISGQADIRVDGSTGYVQ